MKNRKYLLLVLAATLFTIQGYTQKAKVPVLTADSLASGNYKDVLTSFFQLAFNNLTGKQKELKFSSNPYAIMLRANPNIDIDTSYRKYRVWRNLNFTFDLKLDTSYRFNGFSSAIHYAIVNKRDYTVYHEFNDIVLMRIKDYAKLNNGITGAFRNISDSSLRARVQRQGFRLLNDSTFTFSNLDEDVKAVIRNVLRDNNLSGEGVDTSGKESFARKIKKHYEDVKNSFQKKLLWTVSLADTTYSDHLMFSNVSLRTQIVKGTPDITKNSHLEFDIKGDFNLVDDTLKPGRDLKRSMLNAEGGLNWIFKAGETRQPLFELKASAAYNRIFSGMYAGETKERFTLNGTLRARIYADIWIPLEFKYDPKKGNVFGFLSVRANFNALSNLAKGI